LIAVLNLTIERAPTNPKDKAREYLTIIITVQVVTDRSKKMFPKYSLLLRDLPNFKYRYLIKIALPRDRNIPIKAPLNEILISASAFGSNRFSGILNFKNRMIKHLCHNKRIIS
jgi:hypothetical protein